MAYAYEPQTRGTFQDFVARLTNFQIAIPLAFVMIFFWIDGSAIWGPYWEANTALAYILMFALILGVSREKSLLWLSKTNLKTGAVNFCIGFLLMFAGLIVADKYLLSGSLSHNTIASAAVYPSIAITALYVAPVEETIFRGVLKEFLKGWRLYFIPMGIVVTSGLFAITHYAVYGGAVSSLLFAFIMGAIFYVMTNLKLSKTGMPLGVPGSIGAHTCYNLVILGILVGGIVH